MSPPQPPSRNYNTTPSNISPISTQLGIDTLFTSRPKHPSLPFLSYDIPLRPSFNSPFPSNGDEDVSDLQETGNMSSHQHKRPYAGSQPSITRYFAPAISPTNTEPHIYSISQQSQPDTRSASLPAHIQSKLLTVGMSVRKSVPEGYKTGTYCALSLFSDNTPAKVAAVHQERVEVREAPVAMKSRPRARELTPFCGLHSIGGLIPPEFNQRTTIFSPMEDMDEVEDVPALSQSSTISNDSVSTPGDRKRRLDFNEEDTDEVQFEAMRDRTMSVGFGGRAMAVPRRKKKDIKMADVTVVGQENVHDFEDASFLDYDLIGNTDEVEMGGV